MKAVRLIVACAAVAVLAGEASAAPPKGDIPLPRPRPTIAGPRLAKVATRFVAVRTCSRPDGACAGSFRNDRDSRFRGAAEARRRRDFQKCHGKSPSAAPKITAPCGPSPPLATAATSATSPLDLAAVKQAIDLAQKGRPDEATECRRQIYDPVARKLVEWVILRSDDADLDFPRYAAFIAANPSWPGILFLRRRAEAALWQQQLDPRTVIAFFANEPARTAKGRFALARALLAVGDRPGAQALVSAAWRKDGFSADVEAQARQVFAGLITPADDKARMDTRFDVEDEEPARGQRASLAALNSPSPKRAPLSSPNPPRPRRCSTRYRARLGTMPAICSAAFNGCAAPKKIAEAAQLMLSCAARPGKARRRRSMVGRAPPAGAQTPRPWRCEIGL